MRACISPVEPVAPSTAPTELLPSVPAGDGDATANERPQAGLAPSEAASSQPERERTPAPKPAELVPPADVKPVNPSEEPTPAPEPAPIQPPEEIVNQASHTPLDGAIAASISMCGTENKVKAAASSILLIGGSSALKGLGAFLADR